jgi:glycosyltransferase involved in cell wall biosynthesis
MGDDYMPTDLSVIIPIYNEEGELWEMAKQLAVHLDKIIGQNRWQYVLVDNGSFDSTPNIVKRIIEKWPLCVQAHLDRPNYGQALATGLENAKGEWAYIINVDWWDPVFIRWAWQNRSRYDLIVGSKRADNTLNHQQKYRMILSWGLNSLLQFFFGFIGTDTHGQKLVRLSSMRPVFRKCIMRRGQFDTEFTLRAMRYGLWLAEVPVPIVEKRKQRNLMLKKIAQNIWDILILWRLMKKVPFSNSVRYHRWAREDMENIEDWGKN